MDPTPTRDVEALREVVRQGGRPKYLFFWGHQPRPGGSIGKTCFSQWFAAGFTLNDVYYPTAEHYMMAEKARLFSDDAILAKILDAPHPGAAKKLGRQVRNFDHSAWREARYPIVVKGNTAKFSQNEALGSFLLNTGQRVLVEASPVDRIWGIGLAADDPRAVDPELWQGLNLLGFALMEVRAVLRADNPTR